MAKATLAAMSYYQPKGGTLGQSNAEQERPYLAAESGKDRWYKSGRLKASGAGRESEGFVVCTVRYPTPHPEDHR